MNKFLFLILSAFLSLTTIAQEYPTTHSNGPVPKDITQSSLEAIQAKIATMDLSDEDYDTKRDFYSESVYGNAKYLRSGKIIFNDVYSDYVKSVLDTISKYNNGIFDGFRVYIVRDASANAMVGDEGCIFVHIGLLARVENEAQLAFILCHEIIHKQHSHSLNGYLKNKHVDEMYEENDDLDYTDQFFTKATFSRENETEADVEGMKLFEKTPYSMMAVKDVFDVLLYSYLPPEMKPMDFSAFQDKYYVIPNQFIIEKTNPIQANDNYYDSLSSHPNIKKRREFIQKELKDVDSSGAFNLVGEKEFLATQFLARKEMIQIQIEDFDYMTSFYNANMLQYHPNADSAFCHKMMFLSLYGICMISNDVGKERFIYPTRYSQGDFHQWHEFLYDINDEELFAFSMRFGYEYLKNYPHSEWDEKRFLQLLQIFTTDQQATLDAYALTIPNDKDVIDINKVEVDSTKMDTATKSDNSGSKYADLIKAKQDKIDRAKNRKEESEKEVRKRGTIKGYSWQESAFTSFGQDSLFQAYVTEVKEEIKKEKEELKKAEIEKAKKDAENKNKTPKQIAQEEKEAREKAMAEMEENENDADGYADTLVITDAFYVYNDDKADRYLVIEANATGEEFMASTIMKEGEKANLSIQPIFSFQYDSADIDKFNNRAVVKTWFMQMLISEIDGFIPCNQEEMVTVADYYNTNNFAFTFVEREKRGTSVGRKFLILFPLFWLKPAIAFNENYMNVATIVIDARTREVLADDENLSFYNIKDKKLEELYYKSFENIKYQLE